MLACRPFRKFWKAAKFFGGVNKTKPHYYRRYNGSIFVLFTTPKHLEDFQNFLNGRYANISFTIYRCFPIRLSWTKLHPELFFLKKKFFKNGYPENGSLNDNMGQIFKNGRQPLKNLNGSSNFLKAVFHNFCIIF